MLGVGFSERHAEAIAQAVAKMHIARGIKGPFLVGGDTRLMSGETARICAEVLTANGFRVILAEIPLPTPVFSSEILNGEAVASLNGTASHNPPQDMGLKYNPGHGGPAEVEVTFLIEKLANEIMGNPCRIKRIPLEKAEAKGLLVRRNLIEPYLGRLAKAIDLAVIRDSGIKIGIHPLGGTSLLYYDTLRDWYGLTNLEVVDRTVDPTFKDIPLDHDGQIRMDPSSPYPMKPLLDLLAQGKYDLMGASDPDADRFGVATRQAGLLPPNHALSIAFNYLLTARPDWPTDLGVGRPIGTTHLLDRIAQAHDRPVFEDKVGFKYYVPLIQKGRVALAGEESGGMSIFRWTTEKDGILAVLLLAEIMARSNCDLGTLYGKLIADYGESFYRRIDQPAGEEVRRTLEALKKTEVQFRLAQRGSRLAGYQVTRIRDTDGIKLYLEDDIGWALARPSGTEPIVKLYTESFESEDHRQLIEQEAAELLGLAG